MAKSFPLPSSPTLGQIATLASGEQMQWNGYAWVSLTPIGALMAANNLADVVSKSVARGNLGLGTDGSISGFRNRIINPSGAVQVRANSTTVNDGYACDRWKVGFGGGVIGKITVGADVAGATADFTNSSYAEENIWLSQTATVLAAPAAGDYGAVVQFIPKEQVGDFKLGTAYCKPMVLSFVARTKPGMGSFAVGVFLRSATADRTFAQNVTINETPQRYTIAIPVISSGTWTTAGGIAMTVGFSGVVGTTFLTTSPGAWANGNYLGAPGIGNLLAVAGQYFRIRDIQLEEGTIATPIEVRSPSVEVNNCARYFQKSYGTNYPGVNTGMVDCIEETVGSQEIMRTIRFPIRMRATPSVTIYDAVGNVNKITTNGSTNNVAPYAGGADNQGQTGFKVYHNQAGVTRVSFHWAADAEVS